MFWVGMSFALGGLWLFVWLVWLLGGGFFVGMYGGMAALSCIFLFFKIKFPALSAEFLFLLQWQCHEKQELSNELERELRTQALSQHQETISTSEVRKPLALVPHSAEEENLLSCHTNVNKPINNHCT